MKSVSSRVSHLYLPPLFQRAVSVWAGGQCGARFPHKEPQIPSTSTCVLFWQEFKEMTNNVFHTHWDTHTHAPTKSVLAQWHQHKCLHMQESKNSLRSSYKNRPGENKSGTRWTESKCCDSLSFCIWLFVAVRQADRRAERRGERRRRWKDGERRVALQFCCLSSCLIRMRERLRSGGGWGGEQAWSPHHLQPYMLRGLKHTSLLLPTRPSEFSLSG